MQQSSLMTRTAALYFSLKRLRRTLVVASWRGLVLPAPDIMY